MSPADDRVTAVRVLTIGHTNMDMADFVALLRQHEVQVLVDVRSAPYSRYADQFNREVLAERLPREGIEYRFMGAELGGRPEEGPGVGEPGKADYDEMARREEFVSGIGGLIELARSNVACILCSEEDPARCHRALLVGRALARRGVEVVHVRADGTTESEDAVRRRVTGGQLYFVREQE